MTRRAEVAMGIPFTIDVPGGAAPAVLDAAFADLHLVDRLFSPYIADSLVGRIDAGTLAIEDAGPLMGEVVALCRSYQVTTRGWFSAWASGRFDPSGLVKGWAIDRAGRILDEAGCASYFVDGAGDVRTRGERAAGVPWRVGLRHPVRRDAVTDVLAVTDLAIATSGTYERGPHILDPQTGRPTDELVSLTVVGLDVVDADVYATAAFAMGRSGLAFIETIDGYEARAIDRTLHGAETSGFARHRASAERSHRAAWPRHQADRPAFTAFPPI